MFDRLDSGPLPIAFTSVMVKVYEPLGRPVRETEVVVPPSVEVDQYSEPFR